jgi:hypothetical protein
MRDDDAAPKGREAVAAVLPVVSFLFVRRKQDLAPRDMSEGYVLSVWASLAS